MQRGIIQTISEHKLIVCTFLVTILLICLSLYSSIFGVAAFLLNILVLCKVTPSEYTILLYSILPWAYVYKINGVGTSLFAILVMATVLRNLLNTKRIDGGFVASFALFIINVVLQARLDNKAMLMMFIKLAFNLILLYQMSLFYQKKQLKPILLIFVFSVLLSSAVAQYLPNKALLFSRIKAESAVVEFQYARFKGLQNDPNYYNASLVISLLGLCYLYIKREIGNIFFPLASLCVYFGFLTYSKSFFLLLLMWFGVLVLFSFRNKRYYLGLVLLFISAISLVLIFSGRVEVINVLLNRFNEPGGVTTGRLDNWGVYINYFFTDISVLLFGNGFESLVYDAYDSHASHNTYIDLVFYFGIVGSMFLCRVIYCCFRQNPIINRQLFAYIFSLFLFLIYFFLSGITLCEFPFYIFLIFMFFYDNAPIQLSKYI